MGAGGPRRPSALGWRSNSPAVRTEGAQITLKENLFQMTGERRFPDTQHPVLPALLACGGASLALGTQAPPSRASAPG